MNTFAKSMLSLALGLGLSTSAFAQSGPTPHTDKAPAKADVSKAAPAAPHVATGATGASASSASSDKQHNAKQPAKKSPQAKPAEVKKSESGTVHNTAKDLSKPELPAKSVK